MVILNDLIFMFNYTATTEIYPYRHTRSLHDALPICDRLDRQETDRRRADRRYLKGEDPAMKWTSALAIYILLWIFSAFFVLPFHGRRAEDDDVPLVRGQDPGAPARIQPRRLLLHMTIVSAVVFLPFAFASERKSLA